MRAVHLAVVAWLLLAGLAKTADAQPGTLKPIAAGVWFRQGEMEFGHSNNVVIEMDDYLIVVDANYPSGALAVIRDVKEISSKPIKYVINTHHHPDHAYGNPVFTGMGAITLGHIGVVEEMKRYEPTSWQGVAKVRKDVAELNLPTAEPPRQTYSESPYVISDSSRRVELHHFCWGHSRGDTFVYLPKEKVLCTGDVVVNGPYSDPKHAYIANWPIEIRAAQKLEVEYVLPGHGSSGGKELLEGQIQFFEELYKAVDAAIKSGKTLDEVVTMKNDRAIATTIELPQNIQDKYVYKNQPGLKLWQVSRFPTQVMATYKEITQGKPYGEIVGGK